MKESATLRREPIIRRGRVSSRDVPCAVDPCRRSARPPASASQNIFRRREVPLVVQIIGIAAYNPAVIVTYVIAVECGKCRVNAAIHQIQASTLVLLVRIEGGPAHSTGIGQQCTLDGCSRVEIKREHLVNARTASRLLIGADEHARIGRQTAMEREMKCGK